MTPALDMIAACGRTVADIIFAPLHAPDVTVVDIGARNGMFLLPKSYTRRAELIAFEPNGEECARLRARDTEAVMQGTEMPPFRRESYHDCAVWDREETRTLYITRGVGASTMMGEARRDVTGRMYRGNLVNDQGLSMQDRHFAVERTMLVPCRPLDSLVPEDQIVDFLKIDVEGAEMRVLRGADALLSSGRVLCIMTEFAFTQYFEEHPTLGDQQVYLAERGFRLLDLQFAGRRYSRDRSAIPEFHDRRPIYGGDAWLILDPDRNDISPAGLHRLAAILINFGFYSFAVSLLRDAGLLRKSEVDAIEVTLSRVPMRRRLKRMWDEIPYGTYRLLSRATNYARGIGGR